MRWEVPGLDRRPRSSYRQAVQAHARIAEHLPLHSSTDLAAHRRRVAPADTRSPYNPMSAPTTDDSAGNASMDETPPVDPRPPGAPSPRSDDFGTPAGVEDIGTIRWLGEGV